MYMLFSSYLKFKLLLISLFFQIVIFLWGNPFNYSRVCTYRTSLFIALHIESMI